MTEKIKIIFLGAGNFAVPVLEAIVKSPRLDLVGVFTQPDKAAGRKRVLTPSPVGNWADRNHVPCERAASVNTDEFLNKVRELAPDMIVVVSFGQILKVPLLESVPYGCLNVHASVLPKYRGASPIVSCVLAGDKQTGVTFMKMEKGLDTGPIYEIHYADVLQGEKSSELETRLSNMAGQWIEECILKIVKGILVPVKQPESGVSYSGKIAKSDGFIHWTDDADLIERKIRAYVNWPSVSFLVSRGNGKCIRVKITSASVCSDIDFQKNPVPGQITNYSADQFIVACGKGALVIHRVHPEGKKEMSVSDFLRGYPLCVGQILLNGDYESTFSE